MFHFLIYLCVHDVCSIVVWNVVPWFGLPYSCLCLYELDIVMVILNMDYTKYVERPIKKQNKTKGISINVCSCSVRIHG